MPDKKILVVDDEPNVVRTLMFVLKKEGYEVSSAMDGEEAISRVHESKPDLIFLDVMMPRKNGYEVCRELKQDKDFHDIHIVMLSAKGQEADKEMALTLDADEFMTKPFSPAGIVERVKQLLG